MKDVIIVGGGLAGLTSAIRLRQSGLSVLVIEKYQYPFHRLCGEYLSNEVLPYLDFLGCDIVGLKPAGIYSLEVSSASGKLLKAELDLGGIGISRFVLDNYFYRFGKNIGVEFLTGTKVTSIDQTGMDYRVSTITEPDLTARIVIGAFGKRSTLDAKLHRPFFKKRSPFVAVKYHAMAEVPAGTISLHIFKNGYCGINNIEDGKTCICYLTTRENLRKAGSIESLEKNILRKNPYLDRIFTTSKILYEKPETVNEISFMEKEPVYQGIFLAGDSAGMIAPLCGNGMAMAIHSGKILSEEIISYFHQHHNRELLEENYTRRWKKQFSRRLAVGRSIQYLFEKPGLSGTAVSILKLVPAFTKAIIPLTHGKPF